MRKIIQIVCQRPEWLTALCDDGTVWETAWFENDEGGKWGKWDRWFPLPEIPQVEDPEQ